MGVFVCSFSRGIVWTTRLFPRMEYIDRPPRRGSLSGSPGRPIRMAHPSRRNIAQPISCLSIRMAHLGISRISSRTGRLWYTFCGEPPGFARFSSGESSCPSPSWRNHPSGRENRPGPISPLFGMVGGRLCGAVSSGGGIIVPTSAGANGRPRGDLRKKFNLQFPWETGRFRGNTGAGWANAVENLFRGRASYTTPAQPNESLSLCLSGQHPTTHLSGPILAARLSEHLPWFAGAGIRRSFGNPRASPVEPGAHRTASTVGETRSRNVRKAFPRPWAKACSGTETLPGPCQGVGLAKGGRRGPFGACPT